MRHRMAINANHRTSLRIKVNNELQGNDIQPLFCALGQVEFSGLPSFELLAHFHHAAMQTRGVNKMMSKT